MRNMRRQWLICANFNMLSLLDNYNVNDIGFGLILKHKENNENDIQCLLHSNNLCQVVIIYINSIRKVNTVNNHY